MHRCGDKWAYARPRRQVSTNEANGFAAMKAYRQVMVMNDNAAQKETAPMEGKTAEMIEVKQNRWIGILKFIVILGLGAATIFYSRFLILSLP